jgi:hypothetical protein
MTERNFEKELARLKRYDDEISREMPLDFKDWWENSPEEYPLVTRLVLEGRRQEIELWCDVVDRQAVEIKELFEYSQKLEQEIKELKEYKDRLEGLSWETIANAWEQ